MFRFRENDLVRIANYLGERMKHFPNAITAIVLKEKDGDKYKLFVKDHGEVAWYLEDQLTLIENERFDLLEIWRNKRKKQEAIDSDLEYIFSKGKEILVHAPGASIEALAKCLDFKDLWGKGVGGDYYKNSIGILIVARPFLINSDLKGFLKYCEEKKKEVV